MEEIIKDDPILSKAHERYTQFTRNERLMEIYHARMKQQADEKTRLSDAKLEGKLEGKLEVAQAMLAHDLDIQFIANCTGLAPEEVQKLKEA